MKEPLDHTKKKEYLNLIQGLIKIINNKREKRKR